MKTCKGKTYDGWVTSDGTLAFVFSILHNEDGPAYYEYHADGRW